MGFFQIWNNLLEVALYYMLFIDFIPLKIEAKEFGADIVTPFKILGINANKSRHIILIIINNKIKLIF